MGYVYSMGSEEDWEKIQTKNPIPSVTCSRDSPKNQSESEKVLTIGLLLPKEVSDQDEMSYYNR